MGNWTVIGELGAGKTILSVGRIKDFLKEGKRVASNLDINLEQLLPYWSKQTYVRLNDYPQLDELMALGYGSTSKSEKTFGLLALDELSMWLNSHNWNAKGRDEFIVFQRHIRKRHWHTLFIAQDIESIDKQARNALVERVVRAGRLDRMKIPLLGGLLRMFGFSGNLPQIHIGEVHYGKDPKSKVQERWKYYGSDLYNAYNTDQHFTQGTRVETWAGREVEIDGCFSVLSPWHTKGRYLSSIDKHRKTFNVALVYITITATLTALWQIYSNAPKDIICKVPETYIQDGKDIAITHEGKVFNATLNDKNKAVTPIGCFEVPT